MVSLPSERFTQFGNPAWPGLKTANFAAFGSWPGVLPKNAESLRDSDALMRVAVPRRRGPAGLRCSVCNLVMLLFFRSALRAFPCVRGEGWYHYPQRALRAAETPDGRLSKGLICRFLDLIDPSLIPVAQYMISFSLQMQEYPIAAKRRKGCSPLLRQSRHIGARGKFPVRR